MLDEVKKALRIKTNAFDDELTSLINAGKQDLYNAGINADDSDPIIQTAIKTYCKINFGDNPSAERLQRAYDRMIIKLQVAGGYKRG